MLEITRTVNIKIDEAGMKQLIIDKVAAHDPNIVIDEITFVARRNPPSMDAVIVAHMESLGLANAPVTKEPAMVEEDGDDEEYEEDDLSDKADEVDPATAFLESENASDTDEEDPFLEEEPKKKGRKSKAAPKVEEEEKTAWPDDSSGEEEEEEEDDPFL
ncbi:MAG: hypothetical protein ACRCVV_22075 [Shewanella sp.]